MSQKKETHCNVIMTTIQHIVKNYDCSMMLIRSYYAATTVKLRSVITLTYMYTFVIMNLTAMYIAMYMYTNRLNATHGDILAGLDSGTPLVLHLVSK